MILTNRDIEAAIVEIQNSCFDTMVVGVNDDSAPILKIHYRKDSREAFTYTTANSSIPFVFLLSQRSLLVDAISREFIRAQMRHAKLYNSKMKNPNNPWEPFMVFYTVSNEQYKKEVKAKLEYLTRELYNE